MVQRNLTGYTTTNSRQCQELERRMDATGDESGRHTINHLLLNSFDVEVKPFHHSFAYR